MQNPQILELKNVLNNMLNMLEKNIGQDINKIIEVFNEYKNLNFKAQINNADEK